MKKTPWKLALIWAVIAFPVSFVIFNVAFIYWAVQTYPHTNSMAGFAAFIYGFPVGLACSLVAFAVGLPVSRREGEQRPES